MKDYKLRDLRASHTLGYIYNFLGSSFFNFLPKIPKYFSGKKNQKKEVSRLARDVCASSRGWSLLRCWRQASSGEARIRESPRDFLDTWASRKWCRCGCAAAQQSIGENVISGRRWFCWGTRRVTDVEWGALLNKSTSVSPEVLLKNILWIVKEYDITETAMQSLLCGCWAAVIN